MKPAQRDAARALFATVLNERGLQALDERAHRRRRAARAAGHASAIPTATTSRSSARPAASRGAGGFEGHHLSLNVALPAAGHVTVTPFFVGAHPATVRDGPQQGLAAARARPRIWRASSWPALSERAAAHRAHRRPLVRRDRRQPAARAAISRQPRGLELGAMDGTGAQARRGADRPLRRHAGARPRRRRRSSA